MHPDEDGRVFAAVPLGELGNVARTLLTEAGDVRIWLLHGEMGAGKTTLVKEFCRQLDVVDMISSPTFSIVNEYATAAKHKVYHFDFYRIKNEAEALDIGVEEYLYSGAHCFIEWPEKIPSLIDSRHAEVFIRTDNDAHRTIAFSLK